MPNGRPMRAKTPTEPVTEEGELAEGQVLDAGSARPAEFEAWLLQRVREAVTAGEVAATLLPEIQAELLAPADSSLVVGHPVAIRLIAELARVPRAKAVELLAALETKNPRDPEPVLRRIAETWLHQQRRGAPRTHQPAVSYALSVS
jgi:hypothetical protein